jgi:hypothetical protein
MTFKVENYFKNGLWDLLKNIIICNSRLEKLHNLVNSHQLSSDENTK